MFAANGMTSWIVFTITMGIVFLIMASYFTYIYIYPFFQYKITLRKIRKTITEIERELSEKEMDLLSDINREMKVNIFSINPMKNEYGIFHKANKILENTEYINKFLNK